MSESLGGGGLNYGRKIESSDISGEYELVSDAQGNPSVREADRNEIYGSCYSEMFTVPETGAIWQFDYNWKSTNMCSERAVRATSGSGVFDDS